MTPARAGRQGQVDGYRRDGFLVRRGAFGPDEVASCVAECDRLQESGLMHPDNLRTYVLNSERPPDRLDPVIDLSPPLHEIAASVALTSIAAELLDDDALLFKNKVIFKPPGSRGYLAHQDYAYWHWLPVPAEGLLTVVVALDAATPDNGALELFPGLHHELLTPAGAPADVPTEALPPAGHLADLEPGDLVVFHSLTPHRSGANHTNATRRHLFLSFSAATYGNQHGAYYDRLHSTALGAMDAASRTRAYFL